MLIILFLVVVNFVVDLVYLVVVVLMYILMLLFEFFKLFMLNFDNKWICIVMFWLMNVVELYIFILEVLFMYIVLYVKDLVFFVNLYWLIVM